MKKIVLLFHLLWLSNSAFTQSFEEKNGFVAVEAEHFSSQMADSVRRWSVFSEKETPSVLPDGDDNHAAMASGKTYLEILPDTRRTHSDSLRQGVNFTDKAGLMAVLSYKIWFNDTGKYYVWVRAYSTGSEDNGLHVGIDNQWVETGKRMQWCDGKNAWTWESKQRTAKNHCGEPERIFLQVNTVGWHTVHFSMREDGFEFDKFILSKKYEKPEGEGGAEVLSERTSYVNYQNPIKSGIDTNGLRDCQVLRDGDWWYMTGTSYPHWARQETKDNLNKGVVLYRSKDLTHWEFVKWIVERGDATKWYYRRFWAPEIQKIKGKYYATFNCNNDLTGHIGQHTGYAVADKIDGDYQIITEKHPLSNGNDLTFFEDTDGKVWAFWNRGREFGIGFAQIDLATGKFLTEPKSAIQSAKMDYAMSEKGDTLKVAGYDGRLMPKVAKYYDWDAIGIEGAYVIKEKDTYYLFYSSWTRGYEIGYATAKSVTGPWIKSSNNPFYGAQNPQTCEKNGLPYAGDPTNPFNQVGHNAIFKGVDGRYWLSCHGIQKDGVPMLVIDPIDFDKDGNIKKSSPSFTPQKMLINEKK